MKSRGGQASNIILAVLPSTRFYPQVDRGLRLTDDLLHPFFYFLDPHPPNRPDRAALFGVPEQGASHG